MKVCGTMKASIIVLSLVACSLTFCWSTGVSGAFVVVVHPPTSASPQRLSGVHSSKTQLAAVEKVEVCGFKDCKRSGGGKPLQNMFNKILEEKGMAGQVIVEGCDCQGECGYGPNVVVDGKLINGVRGRAAVLQALGLDEDTTTALATENQKEEAVVKEA